MLHIITIPKMLTRPRRLCSCALGIEAIKVFPQFDGVAMGLSTHD